MIPIQPEILSRQVAFLIVFALMAFACRPSSAAPIQEKDQQSKPKIEAAAKSAVTDSIPSEAKKSDAGQIDLFDGETLDGWEVTNFGGEGECSVEEGCLKVAAGYPISGVNSTRDDLPKSNYEISLEVKQTRGIDFFCGLTFPVAESHCTFIVGGWAGSVVGLSCIDDLDASSNDSRKLMKFEDDHWYKIRVRVEPKRIQCWIDAERVVDQNTTGKKISLRNETLASRPLGLCNFETTSHFKNIKLRKLKPGELTGEEQESTESDKNESPEEPDDDSAVENPNAKSAGNDK